MEKKELEPISVFRFVLAFLAAKFVVASGIVFYAFVTGKEPPNISTPITIAALGVALLWYIKAVNRPMTGSEIFRFSIGNTLADITLSVAWGIAMIWQLGASFSWEGINLVLGGGDPKDAQLALIIGLVIGSLQVFLLSAFFAWLMSKNLPNTKSFSKDNQ